MYAGVIRHLAYPSAGRRRGLHVDDVSDLARILRPAGVLNRKRSPVPVRLIEWHP